MIHISPDRAALDHVRSGRSVPVAAALPARRSSPWLWLRRGLYRMAFNLTRHWILPSTGPVVPVGARASVVAVPPCLGALEALGPSHAAGGGDAPSVEPVSNRGCPR